MRGLVSNQSRLGTRGRLLESAADGVKLALQANRLRVDGKATALPFTRASAAWDVDGAGVLTPFPVDYARAGQTLISPGIYSAPATSPGVLIEGQATNGIRNPRAEGATTQTVATQSIAPVATNWTGVNHASGLALDAAPITASNGMAGVRLRYYGTTSATPGVETVEFEGRTNIAAAAGQTWTGSFYYRLVSGTLPAGFVPYHRTLTFTSAAAVVDNLSAILPTVDATLRRATQTMTATGATAWIVNGLHLQAFPANTACDFTIDVFSPQLEQNFFASSPIWPPAGTPAATTRALDNWRLDGPAFASIFGQGAPQGFVITDVIMTAPTVNQFPRVVELHDGTANNRISLLYSGGVGKWETNSASGAVNSASAQSTPAAADVLTRVGVRWVGGILHLSVNGGALVTVSTTAPIGLNAIMLGNRPDMQRPLNGRILGAWGGGRAPPDAKFQAACVPGANVENILGDF